MRNSSRELASKEGKAKGRKFIAVAIPLLSEGELELVQGVRKGLARHDEAFEVVVLSGGYEAPLRKLAEIGELVGTIGEFMSSAWLQALLDKNVAVVQTGESSATGIPTISTDIDFMASEALNAFLDGGIQSFGYLGAAGPPGSLHLGESFAAAASRKGFSVLPCRAFSTVMLRNFLVSLTSPCGILCSSDHLVRLVMISARALGLRIPQDLAVIGVGNSRMESLQAGIEITSFELPFEEMGRRAAELMAILLEQKEGIADADYPIRVIPLFHQRESSLRGGSGITRALAYLRSNPGTSISAGELARLAGMSRRSFEIALRTECGCSPGVLLQNMRRERAERFLKESDLAIGEIGKACGYPEAAVFSTAFRRWTGQSPKGFRAGWKKRRSRTRPSGLLLKEK